MRWPAQRQVAALVVVYGVLVLGRAAVIAFPRLPDQIGRFLMSTGQQNLTPTPLAAPEPAPAGSGAAPPAAPPPAPAGTGTAGAPPAVDSTEWPFSVELEVKAKPNGLWTVAREFIHGPVRIRFEAEGTWKYSPDSSCGADGDMLSMISSSQTILKNAPVGSLIAKIGGSSAGQTDGTLYLIGSFAVIEAGADVKGPLYLTINDDPGGFVNNSGSLKVKVHWKPVTAAP